MKISNKRRTKLYSPWLYESRIICKILKTPPVKSIKTPHMLHPSVLRLTQFI